VAGRIGAKDTLADTRKMESETWGYCQSDGMGGGSRGGMWTYKKWGEIFCGKLQKYSQNKSTDRGEEKKHIDCRQRRTMRGHHKATGRSTRKNERGTRGGKDKKSRGSPMGI